MEEFLWRILGGSPSHSNTLMTIRDHVTSLVPNYAQKRLLALDYSGLSNINIYPTVDRLTSGSMATAS